MLTLYADDSLIYCDAKIFIASTLLQNECLSPWMDLLLMMFWILIKQHQQNLQESGEYLTGERAMVLSLALDSYFSGQNKLILKYKILAKRDKRGD